MRSSLHGSTNSPVKLFARCQADDGRRQRCNAATYQSGGMLNSLACGHVVQYSYGCQQLKLPIQGCMRALVPLSHTHLLQPHAAI